MWMGNVKFNAGSNGLTTWNTISVIQNFMAELELVWEELFF